MIFLAQKYANIHARRSGFTFVESIAYVALLTLMLTVVLTTVSSMLQSLGKVQTARNINRSAVLSMERLMQEVRDADTVNVAASAFDTHPGILVLNTTDKSGIGVTRRFFLDGTLLRLDENGVSLGAISLADTQITNLVFRRITNAVSEGVRIEMTLRTTRGTTTRTELFQGTAVLRGSYQSN